MQVNPQKKKNSLPSLYLIQIWKCASQLRWAFCLHLFDGLDMSLTSITMPLQLSVIISEFKRLLYYIQSNQFAVEKTSHAFYFLILCSVSIGSMSQYGSKTGRKRPRTLIILSKTENHKDDVCLKIYAFIWAILICYVIYNI